MGSSCRSTRCSSETRACAAGRRRSGHIPELLEDVLEDDFNPGRVLDFETDLDGIAEAYAAMDERRAIKSLLRVGTL
jgi:threonine dehydrogenase-like Zn-dependent dehydrogenase